MAGRLLGSLTIRGSRAAAAALAPRVAALGQPVGRSCARRAAAPHAHTARLLPPYRQILPPYRQIISFGTGVGEDTPRNVSNGGGGGGFVVPSSSGGGVVVVPSGGGGGSTSGDATKAAGGGGPGGDQGGGDGCRFDAQGLPTLLEQVHRRETMDSLRAIENIFISHSDELRSSLIVEMKSRFRRNLLVTLIVFFVEILIVLAVVVALVVWIVLREIKKSVMVGRNRKQQKKQTK